MFSTIDKQVNPLRSIPAEFHSSVKCNEFASYFNYKISNIRNKIVASPTDGCDHFLSTQHSITSLSAEQLEVRTHATSCRQQRQRSKSYRCDPDKPNTEGNLHGTAEISLNLQPYCQISSLEIQFTI